MQKQSKPISGTFLFVIVIYQCIWHLVLPIALARLWYKGRKENGYRQHILERLGFYSKTTFTNAIWIHAVSVGETRASAPLIYRLTENQERILLTHTTPTGRQTGAELFKHQIEQGLVMQSYIPYDFCWPVSRFIKTFKPRMALMMETEVWPSLLFFARNHFPVYLINGRLSLKSSLNFAKFGSLSKTLFSLFEKVLAKTKSDADHYELFGIKQLSITGNLKFDVQPNPAQSKLGSLWKARLKDRQVIVVASTREGEEDIIISAWKKLQQNPKPLLAIVPRHLTRIGHIEALLLDQKISFIKRSQLGLPADIAQDVIIGDSMGEMIVYLSIADYVIMGGTLMGTGGQNLIEPIALGKPVILGPSIYNFLELSQSAIGSGIAIQIPDQDDASLEKELLRRMQEFQDHPEMITNMSLLCQDYAAKHQGATVKTLKYLGL
jgi:3-deoxy-D-manno-octulosonic-acid transferase